VHNLGAHRLPQVLRAIFPRPDCPLASAGLHFPVRYAYQITQHRHRPEAEADLPQTEACDAGDRPASHHHRQKREREIRFAKAAAEGEASPEIKAFIDRVLRPASEPFVWHLTRETPVDE
jgi:hypothetical protein